MRPKKAQIGWVYGLPKIHKPFQHLLKFRLIIDTINTPCQGIGKFLTSLLNPLAQNECAVKDSFEAATKINSISFDDMSDEYTFAQLNSCNSSCCNSKDHLNQTNSLVLSEFSSKPLQENSFHSNSLNSKNHLNWTNVWLPWLIFYHVIRILVSESSFFILRYRTVISSNFPIRMP